MELYLEKNILVTFEGDTKNLNLTCLDGTVWVTQRNDPRDHIIRTGASFRGRFKGRVIVMALSSANLAVTASNAYLRIPDANSRHSCNIGPASNRKSWRWRNNHGQS